ncbi:MAG: FAD:protein FMN transferase [Ruminococcus sp.]|nr:FAD:protein FMN transferase [Ruminococcus sp.]
MDFGSLAKGYTSDRLMQLFKENGAESAIVNLGGNVQTLGTKPDGSPWSVGIVNPLSPAENLCIVKIENQAVITSGNYERYFVGDDGKTYWHIIDPKDGYPADNGLISVTVIGESGLLCDALSTALFAEGTEQAVQHYQASDDFEMILVTDDGKILLSEGIQDNFQNISTLPVEVIPHE